jgi:hypothetical protein
VVAKGPETAATMAFPSMALGGGGDYPPPPAPMAGHGQPPGPAAGAPAQPPQMPQQMQQPPQQQQPQQQQPVNAGPGYVPPGQPSSPSLEHNRRPTMEIGQLRRPASSKLAPVLVGLVALVLVIGGVAAWVVMGHKTTPETVIVPLASASVAVADSAAPPASAVEAPSAPSAEPVAPPPAGEEVALSCDPACDEIKVDDKAIELDKPLALPEGKHTVVASKQDFKTVTETITVVAGQKLEKQWKLVSAKAASGGSAPTQTVNKPKCSRFIKVNCQR